MTRRERGWYPRACCPKASRRSTSQGGEWNVSPQLCLYQNISLDCTSSSTTCTGRFELIHSLRLWTKLTDAIKATDMHGATAAKSAVEDHQRELVKQREANGERPPESRFFIHVEGDKWMPRIGVDR